MWSRSSCNNRWKKSRKIVEHGINALKAIWHRGAVDADGKSGDGAGIQIEIAPEFFKDKIASTGHKLDEKKEFALEWFFYLELNMENKKNVEK